MEAKISTPSAFRPGPATHHGEYSGIVSLLQTQMSRRRRRRRKSPNLMTRMTRNGCPCPHVHCLLRLHLHCLLHLLNHPCGLHSFQKGPHHHAPFAPQPQPLKLQHPAHRHLKCCHPHPLSRVVTWPPDHLHSQVAEASAVEVFAVLPGNLVQACPQQGHHLHQGEGSQPCPYPLQVSCAKLLASGLCVSPRFASAAARATSGGPAVQW